MTQQIFSERIDWAQLEPLDVLSLRAAAPVGVFTDTTKRIYLDCVTDYPDLVEIANAVFSNDREFVRKLADQPEIQSTMITLTQLAYKKRIRSADATVRSM